MPALCDRTSSPPAAAAQSAARRQSSLRATEPATVSTLARAASSFAASASPVASTSIRIRVSWSLARRLETARPIPRAAPVIKARIESSFPQADPIQSSPDDYPPMLRFALSPDFGNLDLQQQTAARGEAQRAPSEWARKGTAA